MIDFLVVIIGLYTVFNITISMLVLKYYYGVNGAKLEPLYIAFLSLFIGVPLMIYNKNRSKNEVKYQ